jgi:hypothetical protein
MTQMSQIRAEHQPVSTELFICAICVICGSLLTLPFSKNEARYPAASFKKS